MKDLFPCKPCFETIKISKKDVKIKKYCVCFKEWKGSRKNINDYGRKKILDFKGEPLFAELILRKQLLTKGWEDAVWVDKKNYRIGMDLVNDKKSLPQGKKERLFEIYNKKEKGKVSGCWDIFAWKGDEIKFIEIKRKSKDEIGESQIEFLKAALDSGCKETDFIIVEWAIDKGKS